MQPGDSGEWETCGFVQFPRREQQWWRGERCHLQEKCVSMLFFLAAILLWMNLSPTRLNPDTNLAFVSRYWQSSGWQGVSVSTHLKAFRHFAPLPASGMCLWVFLRCVCVFVSDMTLKETALVVFCFPCKTMVDSAHDFTGSAQLFPVGLCVWKVPCVSRVPSCDLMWWPALWQQTAPPVPLISDN